MFRRSVFVLLSFFGHKDCKDLAILEDIAKIVKKSVQFNGVEKLCDELMETIDKIRKNREKNSVDVGEQKQRVEIEIRELRIKINNHLDKLQVDLMKELTEVDTQITKKSCELLIFLDEREKDLTEYQTNLVNIKQYAPDLQTLLALKQIQSGIETQDTSLQALVNSDSLNQTKLTCKIDTGLKNIIINIEKFGEIVVESKPCELTFTRRKDKQAHIMVSDLQPMSVDNIQLNLIQKINMKMRNISGCCLLPECRMVFSGNSTDTYTSTVSFHNKDGIELFQIVHDKSGYRTFDTVYIKDNNSVAVSSGHGSNRCITMIDIDSQEVKTTISMDTDSYGMAGRGRTIYYSATDEGIKMLNLSDQSVRDIHSGFDCIQYVATSGDKLYYTDDYNCTVTCCDLHGTTQWDFSSDEYDLLGPLGITVDNDGNVYVVSYESHNLMVISSDGQRHRQLLSDEDGLKCPRVLDYDRSTNRLLVVNNEDTAFLFDVTSGQ